MMKKKKNTINENQGPKKRRKLNKKSILALVLMGIAIIGIAIWFIERNIVAHQPKIDVPSGDYTPSENEVDPKLEEIKKLYEENNDLIGWLTIDGTVIDYPVMFTKDEDYYLRKDFYKKYSTAGTLYIDKHQTMAPRDINLLIHGHNMTNGTMFHDLLNYRDEAYYQEHKKIVYYTLEGREEYEVIAAFLSKVYNVNDNVFKYYKFYGEQTESSYNSYIENIKKLSLYNIDLTATYPEKLLTLSTCEYSQGNNDGRMVVVAKQVS